LFVQSVSTWFGCRHCQSVTGCRPRIGAQAARATNAAEARHRHRRCPARQRRNIVLGQYLVSPPRCLAPNLNGVYRRYNAAQPLSPLPDPFLSLCLYAHLTLTFLLHATPNLPSSTKESAIASTSPRHWYRPSTGSPCHPHFDQCHRGLLRPSCASNSACGSSFMDSKKPRTSRTWDR